MKFIVLITLGVTFFSCAEKFKQVNFYELNQKISQSTEALSSKDVMKLYYPKEDEEGKEKITMEEQILSNGNVEVVLIHDNQSDDSVRGSKYVLELEKQENQWIVVSLKRNWRCWDGRGHTGWGIELCS